MPEPVRVRAGSFPGRVDARVAQELALFFVGARVIGPTDERGSGLLDPLERVRRMGGGCNTGRIFRWAGNDEVVVHDLDSFRKGVDSEQRLLGGSEHE